MVTITKSNVEQISALSLRYEAQKCLERGQTPELHKVAGVETLVVDDRAGQSTNGDALWGDWSEEKEVVYLDETDSDGRPLVATLNGEQFPREEWEKRQATN